MQRAFQFSCRTIFVQRMNYSTKHLRMCLPFTFDENQALKYFDQWRKSLWLAPRDWQQTSVTITQRYLPCWSFSFEGTAYVEAYVKRGSWLWGGTEWVPLSDHVTLPNLHLSNVNVYAAHTYDREHVLEIDMKRNDTLLEQIEISSSNEDLFDEWTIDRDTAFEICWDTTVVNLIQNIAIKNLKDQKKDEYRVTSVRFSIDKEIQELIYFPVYIVDYQYQKRQSQCIINGQTGRVVGQRQFSPIKIAAIVLGIIYPACAITFTSLLSFIYYSITRRFVIIPIALLITGTTFPIVTMTVVQLSRYVRDYSYLYRGRKDIREWLDFKKRNPYFFQDKNYQKPNARPIFDRHQTRDSKKSEFTMNIGPNFYEILGVSRVASNSDIKRAYLLKAKEFHPDRNVGNKDIEEKFKLINQAYAILSDPDQRKIFDEYGYEYVKYK